MPLREVPRSSPVCEPVKVAFALAGPRTAPVTLTSSTYQPSNSLLASLTMNMNWMRTLLLPT
jgi:hypothetical protein